MKLIASNKKANYDFEFSLKLDAGLVLTGSEVKSLRKNSVSIKESYIEDTENELWLCNCFIKKYESSSDKNLNHSRKRKLLLKKKELNKLTLRAVGNNKNLEELLLESKSYQFMKSSIEK